MLLNLLSEQDVARSTLPWITRERLLYRKPNLKCVDWRWLVGKTAGMADQTQKCGAQLLFAANMKRIRQEKKLTQEKVAEAANLHPNYISSVERGERNISICNIERIASALGVSMTDLLSDTPAMMTAK